MKKLQFKKTIVALVLGVVFALCAIPTNLGKLFADAAELKDAYKTPSTVDISGSFDKNTTTSPDKWTLDAKYENGEDKNSTSFNGIISTDLLNWDKQFEEWLNTWITNWDKNYTYTFGDSDRAKIEIALRSEITEMLKESPLVPNFNSETTTDHSILAMMAGQTFTKYLNDLETETQIEFENRQGYVKYTSNDFKLDQYSFYKISVWVKTIDGATASITIDGDIEENAFETITTAEKSADTTYYVYTYSDGTNTKTFVSTTENESATLTYNGHTYLFDTDKYIADQSAQNYVVEMADDTITFTGKSKIVNSSDWTEYTIYVSTTTETNINLALALGNETTNSSGSVFFDNVTVEKIQLLDFYKNAVPATTVAVVDNREILDPNNTDSRNYTTVQDFETSHDWTIENAPLDSTDLIIVEESAATGYKETFPQNNPSLTNKVLKVNNHSSKEVVLKTNTINLEKNRYYRISLWALSTQSDASLTMEMFGTKANDTTGSAKDSTKPFVSGRDDDSSHVDNFWVNYIFYVKAPAEKTSEVYVKLTISAGSIIYFDNIVMESVTKTEFTDSKNNKLDLSTTFKSPVVTNGNFFNYENVDIDAYGSPLPPANWSSSKKVDVYEYYQDASKDKFTEAYLKEDLTFNTDETTITLDGKDYIKSENSNIYNYKDGEKIVEKIILVEDALFMYNAHKQAFVNDTYDLEIATTIIAGIINGTSTTNILQIATTTAESTSYKSAVIDMTSTGSLYIISVDVWTDITAIVNLKLVDGKDNVYATIAGINTYNDTNHESEWKNYKFYVGTGLETIKLQIVLEFEENVGTAQFKNIHGLTTTTTSVLDSKLSKSHAELVEDGIAVVNLQKETFIEHAPTLNTTTHLYDSNLYTEVELEGKTCGSYGVLDTTDPHSDYSSITAKDSETSPYVFVIKNNAGESTQLKSTRTFTLGAKKYMKVTIIARVEGLAEGAAANITFTSLGKTFNITSTEFTEYILYIDNSEVDKSATIDYVISLLDTAGTLVIDSISIETPQDITEPKSQNPNGDSDTIKFAVANAAEKQEQDQKDKEKEENLTLEEEDNTLEIFLAVFSSLLLVAAIVFAIVYTRVKALRKPRKAHERNKVKETDDGQKGFV